MTFIRNHRHLPYPLPEELTIDIFLRLPLKSLLRSKSVCKEWHTIITCHDFIKMKFNQQSNRPHLLAYWCGYGPASDFENENGYESYSDLCTLSLFSNETLEKQDDTVNLDISKPHNTLFGSCDGIYCVEQGNILYLWNPATRRLRPLPSPPVKYIAPGHVGFGMDIFTEEFKIVIIVTRKSRPGFVSYSSKDDSWRYIRDASVLEFEFAVNGNRSIFLNGFCYWRRKKKSNTFKIISVDMHNEVFEEMDLPDDLKYNYGRLQLYNDSVAIFSIETIADQKHIDIWLMKEKGCWLKSLTVDLPFPMYRVVGSWNANIVLLSTPQHLNNLIVCDPNSLSVRNVELCNREKIDNLEVYLFNYKESLIAV